jgi:murein DD-endopeptidase MepM/ murein hydrolase activator NlpD
MEEKVPLDFFFLAMAESNLRLNVMSPGGACGMWQFMPGTARTFGLKVSGEVDQRTDALLATRAACRYLKSAHSELGSWTAAAIAYNRGVPGYRKFLDGRNAKSYFEVNDSGENYLYRVMAFKMLMTQAAMRGEAVDKEPVSNPPKWNPLRTKGFEITSGFGMRYDPVSKTEKMHNGIDLKAPTGTIVQAPANGEVIEVGEDDMHGKFIVLRHDNEYTTRYFHLDEVFVPLGQVFIIGKDIGTVGETGRATGPHLHYEILKNGKQVDPEGYLVQPQGAIDGILDRMKVGDPENVPSGVIQKGDGC